MEAGSLTFTRSEDGRVLAGVVAGFGRRHGVDPWVIRGALVLLSFAGGIGLILYAAGAALSDESPPVASRPSRSADPMRNFAVAFITVGLLAVVRSTGLWLGDAVMVPLSIAVAGAAVLAVARADDLSTAQLVDVMSGRHARVRITVGTVLLVGGLVAVGAGRSVSDTVRVGVFAAAISIVGVIVLVGPWIARLAQAAAEERRERIRSEEREAMAAHLHDSVLQTLALIQRSADDPRRTATLARQQERELRAWLFGDADRTQGTLTAAINAMAQEVEQRHDVRVEVVFVGDAPLDADLEALVAAAREACVNAATHSGERSVSVFVEVSPSAVEAFVRDRGRGFDPSVAPDDRHGVSQSIVARMERVGGVAAIESSPGSGTEVRLQINRATDGARQAAT